MVTSAICLELAVLFASRCFSLTFIINLRV